MFSAPPITESIETTGGDRREHLPPEITGSLSPGGEFPEPAAIRAYLDDGNEWVRARHRQGVAGRAGVRLTTELYDHLLRTLFRASEAEYFERNPSLDQRMAILAVGGYGREDLAPFSDLDLVFLHPWKKGPYSENVAERILYALWDVHLDVGFSHRTVDQCADLAVEDMKVRTAMLDARLVAGDDELCTRCARAIQKKTGGRKAEAFIEAKIEEAEKRHERYGGSVYILEPNIKEAEGGLRDIHTALWLAQVHFEAHSFDDLVKRAVLTRRTLNELEEAWDFLLRVRTELHYQVGRRTDRLSFDLQEKVSEALGYQPGDGLLGVEQFMRDYYRHAARVQRFAFRMVQRCRPGASKKEVGWFQRKRNLEEGFLIVRSQYLVADAGLLERDPAARIRAFRLAQENGVEISHKTLETLERLAHEDSNGICDLPGVNDEFRRMLKHGKHLDQALTAMHEVGLLARVIPEMEHAVCLVQHDAYHVYTVDRHTLVAVRELRRIEDAEDYDGPPRLRRMLERVSDPEVLHLAVIFHDIGKGMGGGHSEKGAAMVDEAGQRLGLSEAQRDLAARLVQVHLLMSRFSQRRNLDDPEEIANFCRRVRSLEEMELLYLLTYADVRAVGPGTWTPWKAHLLDDLYVKARRVFDSGDFRADLDERWIQRRELLSRLLARHGINGSEAFLDRLPPSFFLRANPRWCLRYAFLAHEVQADGFASRVLADPTGAFATLAIAAHDRLGLFRDLCGVLAAHGVNINGAQLATTTDGIAIDTFQVSASFMTPHAAAAERWARVMKDAEAVVRGERQLDALGELAKAPSLLRSSAKRIPDRVEIDNTSSGVATVVDVFATDRVGLLYSIASAMTELGLDIHVAKISTQADRVTDSFYVTDKNGVKITEPERQARLRERLLEVLPAPSRA